MVRHLALLAAAVFALSGCPHKDSGRGAGEVCTQGRDCGSGLCLAGACAVEEPRSTSCTPPSNAQLLAGTDVVASDPGSTCQLPIRTAVVPAAQLQGFGAHAVGDKIQFKVPAGTWSVTIVSQAVAGTAADTITYQGFSIPNSVVPTDVRAPDGTLFYTEFPPSTPEDASHYPDYTGWLSYYGGFTPVSGAMTFPNTTAGLDLVRSRGGLPPGDTWTFTVNDFAQECRTIPGCSVDPTKTGQYDIQVITRPGPIASTGTLDLDVYLATTATTAADAPSNAHLQRLFGTLATVLANAGLCLGTVTFHELPQWARDRYAQVNVDSSGPCDPLSQLFTLAVADPPNPSVHLFLVDDLVETSGSSEFHIIGIDGSIPGPSGVPGTINGGAVVPLYDLGHGTCTQTLDVANCGDDRIGYVVAHEAGHWLGLYHTTERYGSLFDPLADTATCGCSACAPLLDRTACAENNPSGEPTSMMGAWCDSDEKGCGGASDLMFWLLDDTRTRAALTREQGETMRLNAAVR